MRRPFRISKVPLIKPMTDISGIILVDRSCETCGRYFRSMGSSKSKSCSRVCADLPSVNSWMNDEDRKKIADHFGTEVHDSHAK